MTLTIKIGTGSLAIDKANIAYMTAHVNPLTDTGTVDISLHKRVGEVRHLNLQLEVAPSRTVEIINWFVNAEEEDYEIYSGD